MAQLRQNSTSSVAPREPLCCRNASRCTFPMTMSEGGCPCPEFPFARLGLLPACILPFSQYFLQHGTKRTLKIIKLGFSISWKVLLAVCPSVHKYGKRGQGGRYRPLIKCTQNMCPVWVFTSTFLCWATQGMSGQSVTFIHWYMCVAHVEAGIFKLQPFFLFI